MSIASFVKSVFRNAPGSPIRELKRYSELPGMISLAGGYPAPELMDAQGLQRVFQDLSPAGFSDALQYGGTEGSEALRIELARLSNTRGLRVDSSDLLVLSGSQQGIDLIARTLVSEGDVVLVEAPTYPAALSAFRLAGARVHQLPTDRHGLCLDDLEDTLRRLKPKLLYTVPSFGNPSGRTLAPERRRRLLELAVRYQCLILEDDPYSELWFDAPPPAPIHALRHEVDGGDRVCVYLSSLSKTLAPALRLGWMLGPADVRRACVLAKQTDDMHASTLTQAAAATYLAHGLFSANLPRLRGFYRDRARALAGGLHAHLGAKIEFDEPEGGMFIWARVPGVDTGGWLQEAIRCSVMFVPGSAFFAQPSDRSTFRLSFASQDEDGLVLGAQRLAQTLADMRN